MLQAEAVETAGRAARTYSKEVVQRARQAGSEPTAVVRCEDQTRKCCNFAGLSAHKQPGFEGVSYSLSYRVS